MSEHIVSTHATAFGWGWGCSCGRAGKGNSARSAESATAYAYSHIRADRLAKKRAANAEHVLRVRNERAATVTDVDRAALAALYSEVK